MADYSLKLIRDVKIGDYVLSIDTHGNIGTTKVIDNLHYDKDATSNFYSFNENNFPSTIFQ